MVIKMTKNLRTVKASLIIGIMLVSVFAIMIPIAPADEGAAVGGFQQSVTIEWAEGATENASEPIVPYQDTTVLNMKIVYRINKGAFGGLLYSLFYANQQVHVKLTLVDWPKEWSTVSIPKNTFAMTIPGDYNEPDDITIAIQITTKANAPAFTPGTIKINAKVDKMGMLAEYDETLSLDFKAAYVGMLTLESETQFKLIGPMDTTVIPIKVHNRGNGRTRAYFEVENIPDGWLAVVTNDIILDVDEVGTIFLTVKPPKGIGYHDEQAQLRIRYTPKWAEGEAAMGDTNSYDVTIESRGVSLIGIEIILPIIILIIVLILLIYTFVKRKLRK